MQSEIDDLAEWSKANHMNINTNKTKEMLIGHSKKDFSPTLQLDDNEIERVSVYKLLGLYVNDNFTWDDHVTFICAKSAKRQMTRTCSSSLKEGLRSRARCSSLNCASA